MMAPVVIVDYNPHWPVYFAAEKTLIRQVLGAKISRIEHFGSTAVPHLAAKNTIDIMAGVHGIGEADRCLAPLAQIGYTDVTAQSGNPDWYYCLGKSQPHVGTTCTSLTPTAHSGKSRCSSATISGEPLKLPSNTAN